MNTEEIQKLKEKIKKLENQDVYIELEQSIQYHTTINKAKIIVIPYLLEQKCCIPAE